jgi:hypothetical protein
MRQQQIILMTVVMFMFLIFIAAGGYYYTTTLEEETKKKTGSCSGTDANGVYEYDDDGNCVFKGCKSGYALEGGYCIIQRDYTADMDAGIIPVNCEIGGYIEGPCVDEIGRQLTGESGRCGTGMKTFTADPSAFSMANSLGECENFTYTESCEVPCRTAVDCNATDDNYTKTDGVCRGLDGNPIGGDTGRCGTGYQIYEVDPATAGNFESDELRDAWVAENWKDCTPLKKTCNVVCETGMESSGCPDLSDGDFETSYVMDNNGLPACLEKDLAVSILKGEVPYQRNYHPMKILSRQEAKNKGRTMDTLPEGYKILYRTGVTDFSDFNAKGCDTAVLETCFQPTTNENCTLRTEVTRACYPTGCGKPHNKDIQVVVEEDAWGSGTCDMSKLGPDTVGCTEEMEPECCSVDNDNHWTTPVSYSCSSDGTYNLVNTSACSTFGMTSIPTKTENCCYVHAWEEGECNQDNQDGKRKYTRTIDNVSLCGVTQLNSGVRGQDSMSTVNPTVKYSVDGRCAYLEGVKTVKITGSSSSSDADPTIYFQPLTGSTAILQGLNDAYTFDAPVSIRRVRAGLYGGNSQITAQALDNEGNILKTFSVTRSEGDDVRSTKLYRTNAPAYKMLERDTT